MKHFKQITAAFTCAAALFTVGCASTDEGRSTGQVIDDTAVHAKVKAALLNDPVVAGTAINVDVERGVVMLDGAVNGAVAKRKAEEIARGVDGVRSVQNNIVIRQYQNGTGNAPSVDIDADVDADDDKVDANLDIDKE